MSPLPYKISQLPPHVVLVIKKQEDFSQSDAHYHQTGTLSEAKPQNRPQSLFSNN